MKERLGPRPDNQRSAVIAGRRYADIRNAEDPGRKERNERAWALKRKEEEEEKERQKIKKRKEEQEKQKREEEEERERQKTKKRKEEQEKRKQEEKERERESTKIKKAFAAASPEEKKVAATMAYKQLEERLTERKKYEKLKKRYLEVAQREAAEPGSQELNLSLLQYAMTEVLTGRDPDDGEDEDDDDGDDDEEDEDDVEIMATEEIDP